MYNRLINFIEINKKLPIYSSKDPEEILLNKWCKNQKKYKTNNLLINENIKLLESINGWNWNTFDTIFSNNYNELLNFVNNNNKLPSKSSHDKKERSLGEWCSSQRIHKKNNNLPENKIKLLENIKIWKWNNNNMFNDTYEKLLLFVKNEKRIPISPNKNYTENYLGSWCTVQRRKKRNNKLSTEQIELLEKLEEWYWDKNTEKK